MFLDPILLVPVGPWWSVLVQAIGIYLLVDFISGILHWSEDRYGSETTPLIGNAIKKNILHHHRPRHITRITLWEAMGATVFIAFGIFAVGTLLGLFGWQLLLLSLLGMNVNTVHRWRTHAEGFAVGRRALQRPPHRPSASCASPRFAACDALLRLYELDEPGVGAPPLLARWSGASQP